MKPSLVETGKRLARHKWVYEQHQQGRTYVEMAGALGISSVRVRQLALRWKRHLAQQNRALEAIA